MSKAKLERQLNLMAALLNTTRPLTAAEIATRVPGYTATSKASFQRAFERDKEDLKAMGIPLTMEPVAGATRTTDGYLIRREDYYLETPDLDADEEAALRLLAEVTRSTDTRGAVQKLGAGALAATAGEHGHEHSGPAIGELPVDERLSQLFTAVTSRSVVRFVYRSARGSAERTFEPLRLQHARGHWYLSGHDRDQGEARTFRLDRIEGAVVLTNDVFDAPTDPPPSARLDPWTITREAGEEPVTALVAVEAERAGWVADRLGPEAVDSVLDDGRVVFSMDVSNRVGFRTFVLGFLEHAEVLGPPELRSEVRAWLSSLAGEG